MVKLQKWDAPHLRLSLKLAGAKTMAEKLLIKNKQELPAYFSIKQLVYSINIDEVTDLQKSKLTIHG